MSKIRIIVLSGLVLFLFTLPSKMISNVQAEVKVVMQRLPLESPQGMTIYKISIVKADPKVFQGIIRDQNLRLKEIGIKKMKLYMEESATEPGAKYTRMALDQQRGHMFMLPNLMQLAKSRIGLLPQENAFQAAKSFIEKQKLIQADGSQATPSKMIILSKADLSQDGKIVTTDVLQTVLFQRTIDKKPVMGNGSQLTVNLAENGKIVGFNRTWNRMAKSTIKPIFLSEREVYDSIESNVKKRFSAAGEVVVKKPHLIYYGNEQRYIQPAYFYTVEISAPDSVQKSYFAEIVTAVKNSPEAIMLLPDYNRLEKPMDRHSSIDNGGLKGFAYTADNDPTVGRYVVRNDSWDWVDDANDFKNGLNAGHPSGYPVITFGDYLWNYPSYWTTSEGSYVDKWNISLMEGHGNTWLFTTRSNCCDIVNLNSSSQPGYGDRPSTSMRYLILKGCAIIPASIDRSNWADPWWRIFKGLRQAVGFRTSMYINDDISYHFGYHIAQNCRVLDSWFHSTDNCSSYQWERFWGSWGDEIYGYGAVVMIPNHEGDGIYSTGAAPNATSTGLAIWYQH